MNNKVIIDIQVMKRIFALLALSVTMAAIMAQSYNMVIHVENGATVGIPDGQISIPVDIIREVTFEEITDNIIPDGTTPITFQFQDYTTITPTRSRKKRAPVLETRKYGVFACYNNGEIISQDKFFANLMNNQEVAFSDGVWKYSPTVNWPEKEQGSNYVSFFAYSPYSGNVGNEFVSVNSESREPVIDYYSNNPLNDTADLLYGSQLNVTKTIQNGCVNIQSKHALSRLNLKARLANDGKDENTKVTIKSIKISGQIPNRGAFDLKEQLWKNLSTETQTYTLEGNNLAEDLRDAGDTFAANQPEGVTTDSKSIGISPFLFIPTNGEKEITITVDYSITTDDSHLSTGYSRVNNVISKTFNLNLISGYCYDMQINFGMTSLTYSLNISSTWETSNAIINW